MVSTIVCACRSRSVAASRGPADERGQRRAVQPLRHQHLRRRGDHGRHVQVLPAAVLGPEGALPVGLGAVVELLQRARPQLPHHRPRVETRHDQREQPGEPLENAQVRLQGLVRARVLDLDGDLPPVRRARPVHLADARGRGRAGRRTRAAGRATACRAARRAPGARRARAAPGPGPAAGPAHAGTARPARRASSTRRRPAPGRPSSRRPRSWPSTANSCSALRSMAAADTASGSAPASRRPHPATARPVNASGRAAIRAVRAVVPRGSPSRPPSPGLSPRCASTYAPTIVFALSRRYPADPAATHMLAGSPGGPGPFRRRVRVPPGQLRRKVSTASTRRLSSGPAVQPELGEHRAHVGLHRLRAQVQPLADGLVGAALGHHRTAPRARVRSGRRAGCGGGGGPRARRPRTGRRPAHPRRPAGRRRQLVDVGHPLLEQVAGPRRRRTRAARSAYPGSTCAESTRTPIPGWVSRSARAASRPSVVWVGGMRMSTTTASGGSSCTAAEQCLRVADPGRDREAGLDEQQGQALPEQHGVVGERNPQGGAGRRSSATWRQGRVGDRGLSSTGLTRRTRSTPPRAPDAGLRRSVRPSR